MLVAVLLFIAGLILLIKGGDWFVDGASGIAKRFRLPELLIGATVVSIGTTLPEVMVSTTGALSGHSDMAFGNSIGSIICNVALIAAITLTFKPGKVDRKSLVIPSIFFLIASTFFAGIAYFTGFFYRIVGIIFLLMFAAYITIQVIQAIKAPKTEGDTLYNTGEIDNEAKSLFSDSEDLSNEVAEESELPLWRLIMYIIIGAAFIAIGAQLLVNKGSFIAENLGVPESVIAITVIAIGTSLPELVTAITSIIKGHGALSIGNVLGANLFNIILVLGTANTLKPFAVPTQNQILGMNSSLVMEIPVMFLVMGILLIPTFIRGKASRVQGIILLTIYLLFTVCQFVL